MILRASPGGLVLLCWGLGCSSEPEPPYQQQPTAVTSGETSAATGMGGSSVTSSSSAASTNGSGSVSVSATGQGVTSSSASVSSTGIGGGGSSGQGGSDAAQGGASTGQGGGMTSAGGTSAGGTGNAMGGTGGVGGGAVVDAQPSPGCGSGNASPSLNLENTIVSIPPTHDGTTPVPVVMAFHPAGNPNTVLQDRLGDDLEDKYLVLYPKSAGSGWDNNADGSKVDAMFTAITNDACIDENRVFATGHSSGAQFIVQRLCAGETRFRAVAPVASSVYCNSWDPVPALVIHGIGDVERSWDPDGEDDIVPYRESNGCSATSTAYPVEGCSSGNVQVDPGCVQFDGCSEQTLWCQHNDPQYGTSHHGIPCFADGLIPEFFDSF